MFIISIKRYFTVRPKIRHHVQTVTLSQNFFQNSDSTHQIDLEEVTEIKFLGAIIKSDLLADAHANKRRVKGHNTYEFEL